METSTVQGIQSLAADGGYTLSAAAGPNQVVVVTVKVEPNLTWANGVVTAKTGRINAGGSVAGDWAYVNPAPSTPPSTGGQPQTSTTSTSTPSNEANPTLTTSGGPTTFPTDPLQSPPVDAPSAPNGGVIAGVAVGCLIAGLLLGVLIAYIVFGRRRKQAPIPVYAPVQYESQEKQGPTVVASSAQNHREQLDKFLLDSRPDGDIAGEARSLNQLIQQHVENHYHLHPVQQDSNVLAQILVDLGIGAHQNASMGPVHLAALAMDPRTRYAALRHIIVQAALNASSMHSTSPISLLPQNLGTFSRSIPPVEQHRGSTQAVQVALTRWRQLSAFLLNPNRSERTSLVPTEDVSTQQAQQLTTALERFVGAFASRDREEAYEQENHLREVIVECATFGYVLFSQPAEFYLRYEDGHKSQKYGGIITFPGLEKIRDETGQKYPSPITVTAPVTER